MSERIYLYDSTLRDGAQARGIDFTVADKLAICAELDAFGIDYIEGGWPGANPTDDAFFAKGSPCCFRHDQPRRSFGE
jgi:2-isopropylmalate synthase